MTLQLYVYLQNIKARWTVPYIILIFLLWHRNIIKPGYAIHSSFPKNKYIDIIFTKVLFVAPYFIRRDWYAFARGYFVVCQGYILYISKIDDKWFLENVLWPWKGAWNFERVIQGWVFPIKVINSKNEEFSHKLSMVNFISSWLTKKTFLMEEHLESFLSTLFKSTIQAVVQNY